MSNSGFSVQMSPSFRAGLDVYGEIRAGVAAAGVYARGTLVDLSYPLSVGKEGECARLTWEAKQSSLSLKAGFFYRLKNSCRLKRIKRWKWKLVCKWGGKKDLGKPKIWGGTPSEKVIIDKCL